MASKITQLPEQLRVNGNEIFLVAVNGVSKQMKADTLLNNVPLPSLVELGLDKVDNTSDLDKPISTATQYALNNKADKNHKHVIGDINGLQTELDRKADKEHNHEIDEVNGLTNALNNKADKNHTHDFAHLTEFVEAVKQISPKKHIHEVEDINGLDGLLDAKANKKHTHEPDEINGLPKIIKETITNETFIKPEDISGLDDLLANKADKDHKHEMADVNGLTDVLDNKADKEHNHEIDEVNGLTNALDNKADRDHIHSVDNIEGLNEKLTTLKNTIENTILEEADLSELKSKVADLETNKADKEHTHEIEDVVGLNERLANMESTIENTITEKIGDVDLSGLKSKVDALAEVVKNKSDKDHKHEMADVNGLTDALDAINGDLESIKSKDNEQDTRLDDLEGRIEDTKDEILNMLGESGALDLSDIINRITVLETDVNELKAIKFVEVDILDW